MRGPTPPRRRRRCRARALLAAVLLSAGCGRAAPDRRLVVAYPLGPSSLLPEAALEEFANSVLSNVYERLVRLDENLAMVPGLAQSWHTPDDATWVFRIRKDARWHDGDPVTAQDLVGVFERIRTDPESRLQGDLAAVASLEAPSEDTLVFRMRERSTRLPNRLVNVPIARLGEGRGDRPVGSGPYRVKRWRPGGDTLLEAVSVRGQGGPDLREAEFRVVAAVSDRVRLLNSGAVHLIVDVPASDFAALAANPLTRGVARQGLRVVYLGMDCSRDRLAPRNTDPNPFRDPRVRRAVTLAIDRARMVGDALGGFGDVLDQVVSPEVFGFNAHLRKRAVDTEEARRLMASAGVAAGFAVELHYPEGKYRGVREVVGSVASDLAGIGIRVTPRGDPPAAFLGGVEARSNGFYLSAWSSTTGDAAPTYAYLLHSKRGRLGRLNGTGYANPAVDALIEQVETVVGAEERKQLLARMAELVEEDAPIAPLYRQVDLYGLAATLEFAPRLDRQVLLAEMRWRHPAP